MDRFSLYVTVIGMQILASSCNQENFTGNSDQFSRSPKRCVPSSSKPCKNEPVATESDPPKTGDDSPKPLLSTDGGGLCFNRAPNIDFVFAMDVSGSMQSQSNRVNAAFSALAQNLSNIDIPGLGRVPNVRIGLVTFEDSIIFSAPLNDNLPAVSGAISTNFRAVERSTDGMEGGLLAAAKALETAKVGADSVKVLFIVTDAYAHDGTGSNGNRNYSTAAIEQVLRDPAMKMTFIYSAADFSGGNGSGPTRDAVDQWRNLRATAGTIGGHGLLGKDFDVYEFSANDVSSSIPQDIAANLHKCK
jgi:hypothetical protein